ncbi:hypothetical protein [Streptomyces sp. NPDC005209]|uniref:hypothetical protein n=1 Tax=Streptomyces sp. NPDC005209 TaxID=3156715 RepID=UPI0033B3512C
MAAALAGVPRRQVRPLLTELTGASLLIEHAPGRFVFHDLLRAYAHELVTHQDGAAERDTVVLRMYDHYLHTAHHASAVLGPYRETIPLAASTTDSGPLWSNDSRQAIAWLRTERLVLRSVVEQATAHGHAWRTAYALDLYFDRLGYWRDLMEINKAARPGLRPHPLRARGRGAPAPRPGPGPLPAGGRRLRRGPHPARPRLPGQPGGAVRRLARPLHPRRGAVPLPRPPQRRGRRPERDRLDVHPAR